MEATQYAANAPCEDTYSSQQLAAGGRSLGYYNAVFDGHGGWQLSDYAGKHLHRFLEKKLEEMVKEKGNLSDADYKEAIEYAFDAVEEDFLKLTREGFQKGFPRTAYVGACALVTVVADNKAYVASAGDCKAGTCLA